VTTQRGQDEVRFSA